MLSGAADLLQVQEPNRISDFVLSAENDLDVEHAVINSSVTNSEIQILKKFLQNESPRSFHPRIQSFILSYGKE